MTDDPKATVNYIVLCECAEGPDRSIIAWINDLRPRQKQVSITGTSGFTVTRRGRRTRAGARAVYRLSCSICKKKSPPIAENTVTAIVDRLKPQAAQLETVIAPDPPDIGVPRPGWHATATGPVARHVIGFGMLLRIVTEIGKRGAK